MYLTLIESFPTTWVYWHSRIRKPAIFIIIAASAGLVVLGVGEQAVACEVLIPLAIQLFMLALTFRMHQETMFPALDFPETTTELESLPIGDDEEIALIEVGVMLVSEFYMPKRLALAAASGSKNIFES